MKKILVCSCFNMKKKAAEAFSLLFPKEILPEVIKGKDSIYKFAQSIDNDHIKAISKLSGKFAFYVKIEENKVVEEYNLLTGKRVA